MDLGEHQVRERRLQLVLVGRAADGPARRAFEEAVQGALRETDRHAGHEAERPIGIFQDEVGAVARPHLDPHRRAVHRAVVDPLQPVVEVANVLGRGRVLVAIREPRIHELELP